MRSDSFQFHPRDRAKSAAATAAIHLVLGAALLTGLSLQPERMPENGLKTFAVEEPPRPPPAIEAPSQPAKSKPAPAGAKADPSPIVVPPAKLPSPQPIAAAPVAGAGSLSNAGAAARGAGIGAGGSGDGADGAGNGAGRTGARLMSGGLGRRDYRQIAALGSSHGHAELLLLVNPAGRVENCRAVRSSGNSAVDHALCQTLLARARFWPAREANGSPLYQEIRYFPTWGR